MIHQVKPSPIDVAKLRSMVELQLFVLESAIYRTTVSKASIEEYLEQHQHINASKAAKWIVDKPIKFLKPLNDFAAHSDFAAKQEFVKNVRADVNLLFEPTTKRLLVSMVNAPAWQKAAGDFCYSFYEFWDYSPNENTEKGFPKILFTNKFDNKEVYSRWDFLDGFKRANQDLYLCVICDAAAYQTKEDNQIFASIEHFFPKSIYPHLAIHPYNLIPICPFCNSKAGSEDVMSFCRQELGVKELLLPYSQSQLGFSLQAYVDIQWRDEGLSEGEETPHPLKICLKPASGHDIQSVIDNFNKTYKIEKRWNADLDMIGEHTFRRIQQFLLADVQMGNDLSDWQFVKDRLDVLMALTSRHNLGKDPYAFVTMWMLKYFVDTINKQQTRANVYQELKLWATNQLKHWQELKKYALEIHQRVPESITHTKE